MEHLMKMNIKGGCKIVHVYREQNQVADELAKLAFCGETDWIEFYKSPLRCRRRLQPSPTPSPNTSERPRLSSHTIAEFDQPRRRSVRPPSPPSPLTSSPTVSSFAAVDQFAVSPTAVAHHLPLRRRFAHWEWMWVLLLWILQLLFCPRSEPRETNEALSVNKSTPPACEKVPAAKGGEIMNEILIENCGVEPVEGVEDLNVNEGTPPVCQHGHKIQENGGIPPVCGNVSMRIEEPNAPITEQVQGVKQGHVEISSSSKEESIQYVTPKGKGNGGMTVGNFLVQFGKAMDAIVQESIERKERRGKEGGLGSESSDSAQVCAKDVSKGSSKGEVRVFKNTMDWVRVVEEFMKKDKVLEQKVKEVNAYLWTVYDKEKEEYIEEGRNRAMRAAAIFLVKVRHCPSWGSENVLLGRHLKANTDLIGARICAWAVAWDL
nr:hypothetical protein Itr_chr14CG27040 [Ipomoea trifida]